MSKSCAAFVVCGALVAPWQAPRRPIPVEAAVQANVCAPGAFLTFEKGRLASVDWVERTGNRIHSRVVETQSHVIDATIDLRPDGTASHSAVVLSTAGADDHGMSQARDLGEDAVYWSPRIFSSVEHAIARARILQQPSSTLPGASLYSESRVPIRVDRVTATDWTVRYQDTSYQVHTDQEGCVQAATLPEFGVTIERRSEFATSRYPLWAPYDAPPDRAYRAVDAVIPAPHGRTLAGTLTTPADAKRVPAALLITGLSPHERNNGDAPWMPFRDIADAFTRAGVAVLRVDDRGVGKSTGDRATMTIFDKADDVRTEIAWLRSRPEIDPARVALVGYSEGGLIARMVAASDNQLAAIVTLAGPGVPGLDVARYQVEQPILRNRNVSEEQRPAEIEKQLADALKDLSPHEQTYLAIDPLEYDRQVRCPALVVQGATDAHVPLRSAERIADAMRAAGNADVTVRIFPGVSHSLLPDPGGLASGWAGLPGFLTDPPLIESVTDWIVAHLTGKPQPTTR